MLHLAPLVVAKLVIKLGVVAMYELGSRRMMLDLGLLSKLEGCVVCFVLGRRLGLGGSELAVGDKSFL